MVDGINVIRDGTFEVLGKCLDNPPSQFLTYIEDKKYIDIINKNMQISCVICKKKFVDYILRTDIGIAISEYPKYKFFLLHNQLFKKKGIINRTIGNNCLISPKASLLAAQITIGNNVIIEDNVVIKGNVIIEDNVIIRAGTIIGCSSFQNCKIPQGGWLNVIEEGIIHICENTEIGEMTVIDNAVFFWDKTIIGKDSFVAAKVIIGHGCKIGNNVSIKAGAIICGFVIINDNVTIAPGSVILNRVTLEEDSIISLGAIVTKNTKKGERVSGNFAVRHDYFLKHLKEISEDSYTGGRKD